MNYPETPRKPVTDEFHGIPVEDRYRWLEDSQEPTVQAWADAQNQLVRETLDAVPQCSTFYGQLKKIYSEASADYCALQSRPGRIFAMKKQPPLQQPLLVIAKSCGSLPHLETARVSPSTLSAPKAPNWTERIPCC